MEGKTQMKKLIHRAGLCAVILTVWLDKPIISESQCVASKCFYWGLLPLLVSVAACLSTLRLWALTRVVAPCWISRVAGHCFTAVLYRSLLLKSTSCHLWGKLLAQNLSLNFCLTYWSWAKATHIVWCWGICWYKLPLQLMVCLSPNFYIQEGKQSCFTPKRERNFPTSTRGCTQEP